MPNEFQKTVGIIFGIKSKKNENAEFTKTNRRGIFRQ